MRELLKKLFREIESFYGDKEFNIPDKLSPGNVKQKLDPYDFNNERPLPELFDEVVDLVKEGTLDVTHPSYFGLFNPSVTLESIVADALVALYNPQLAVWEHAPMPIGMEQQVLSFIGSYLFSEEDFFAHFTTGGSEANMTGVLAALASGIDSFTSEGLAGTPAPPVFYLSEHAHHSFEKITKSVGLGMQAVRRIPGDSQYRMDMGILENRLKADQDQGYRPFLVVGTAGTTSYGTIDPLKSIARFCRRHDLWFHVDAAWGGAAVMSDRLKPHMMGIEQADSVTIDAHKWFSVGMGAGMFFTRHPNAVKDMFSVDADYVPESNRERLHQPYLTTLQWSRRFIGLKLFMTLASSGVEGVTRRIEHQTEMGNYLRESLRSKGWEIVNDTPLPLVCFTHEKLKEQLHSTSKILDEIHKEGRYWISDVNAGGGNRAFRACITSFRTREEHIDAMVDDLTGKIAQEYSP
ncbi:MAG: pyridoxal-dependent decarboxylase [Balneolaceae bacterium]|nr:pyridoxal-dependent decarboxylase [Balneolaceae bacterium]